MTRIIIAKDRDVESYYLNALESVYFSDSITKAIELALVEIKKLGKVDNLILFGFSIKRKQLDYVNTLLKQVLDEEPEIEIEHYSTFGECLDEIGTSYIEDDVANIKELSRNHLELFTTPEEKHGVSLLQQYHVYEFPEEGIVEIFRALINFYGKSLGDELNAGIKSLISRNSVFVNHYYEDKEQYMRTKLNQVKTFGLKNDTTLYVVYAERFINEISHRLIGQCETSRCIVLIGRPTQYSDMYSVRTFGVDAGKVAETIGDGGGKENTGNFFLDSPYSGMLQSLVQYLNSNL